MIERHRTTTIITRMSLRKMMLAICVACAGVTAPHVALGSLVFHLDFDDNLTDTGSLGITGITKGSAANYDTDVPPGSNPAGKSLLMAPTADNDANVKVTVPDNAGLNFPGSFTLTTWLKPTSMGKAGLGTNIYSRFLSSGNGFFLNTSWNPVSGQPATQKYLRFNSSVDGANVFTATTTDGPIVTIGTDWVFMAFSYDATTSTAKTYFALNSSPSQQYGPLAGTVFTGAGAPNAISLPATLGLRYDGNRAQDGRLDDFRLYDSALSASEIEDVRASLVPEPSAVSVASMALILVGLGAPRRQYTMHLPPLSR
jgi:hypothetical protein